MEPAVRGESEEFFDTLWLHIYDTAGGENVSRLQVITPGSPAVERTARAGAGADTGPERSEG